MLGGGFYATRLYQDLRENSGLVYFVSSSFGIGKTRSVYRVNYACDPQNVLKARAVVQRDLKDDADGRFPPNELRRRKGHAAAADSARAKRASTASRADLMSRATIGLPLDEPDDRRAPLRGAERGAGKERVWQMAAPG